MATQRTPPEVIAAFLASTLFWALVVAAIYVLGRSGGRAGAFQQRMLAQWKPALAIALVYAVSAALGAKLDPGRIAGAAVGSAQYFCEALVGLTLAYSLPTFEPMPAARAVGRHERPWRAVTLMLGVSVLAGAIAILIGALGQGIIMSIVGEKAPTSAATNLAPSDKVLAFFSFLAGAGIAEETPYRLVLLSLVWRLAGGARVSTRGRGLAIWVSALAFAAYHFTPLNSIYFDFWQYPISHFVASMLIGLVWGLVYTRRGYGTAVLSHTISDWIPVLLFL